MGPTLYDEVGGSGFFDELVERFYEGVAADDVLRPMYPDDLTDAKRHLALFLIQYWGGPGTYSAERGHPRLRQRHFPFPVDADARDRWLTHMRAAVAASNAPKEAEAALLDYFEKAADFLVNR